MLKTFSTKYTDFDTLLVVVKYMLLVCDTDFSKLIAITVDNMYKHRQTFS